MSRLQQSRRQRVGYTYEPQICNNVAKIPYMRNPYYVQKLAFDQNQMGMGGMEGEGFMDFIRGIVRKGKKAGKFLYEHKGDIADAYSGEIGTTVRNLLPGSDETARPGFPGEKHAILKLPNGKYGVANYMGPGTNLLARLKRGDPPRTEVDKVAQGHDIRYGLAKQQSDIRKADNIMLNKVAQIARNRGDDPKNIAQARLIKLKTMGEDLGVLKKDAFSGDLSQNKNLSDKDRMMMMSKVASLGHQGYGLNVPGQGVLPGDALKIKLLRQMMKKKKSQMKQSGGSRLLGNSKETGQSMSKTLPGMKNYKMKGKGLRIPGQGAISDFVVKKVIPSILSSVGVSPKALPINMITKVVTQALKVAKSGNLPSIISHLSKTILPLITHAKLKTIGVPMSGSGVMDLLGDKKNSLLANLGKGLFGAFKWFINTNAKREGVKMPFKGSGLGLPGGSWSGFWKGFKKGFTDVFKPFAKIAAPIATAIGVPEIGIPLGIVGDAL